MDGWLSVLRTLEELNGQAVAVVEIGYVDEETGGGVLVCEESSIQKFIPEDLKGSGKSEWREVIGGGGVSGVICPNVLSLMKTMDLFFDWSLGGET